MVISDAQRNRLARQSQRAWDKAKRERRRRAEQKVGFITDTKATRNKATGITTITYMGKFGRWTTTFTDRPTGPSDAGPQGREEIARAKAKTLATRREAIARTTGRTQGTYKPTVKQQKFDTASERFRRKDIVRSGGKAVLFNVRGVKRAITQSELSAITRQAQKQRTETRLEKDLKRTGFKVQRRPTGDIVAIRDGQTTVIGKFRERIITAPEGATINIEFAQSTKQKQASSKLREKQQERKDQKFFIGTIPRRDAEVKTFNQLTTEQKRSLIPNLLSQIPKRQKSYLARVFIGATRIPISFAKGVNNLYEASKITIKNIPKSYDLLLNTLSQGKIISDATKKAQTKKLSDKEVKETVKAIKVYKEKSKLLRKLAPEGERIVKLIDNEDTKMARNLAILGSIGAIGVSIGGVTGAVTQVALSTFGTVVTGLQAIRTIKDPTPENIGELIFFTLPTVIGVSKFSVTKISKAFKTGKATNTTVRSAIRDITGRITKTNRAIRLEKNLSKKALLKRRLSRLKQARRELIWLSAQKNIGAPKQIVSNTKKLGQSYSKGIHKDSIKFLGKAKLPTVAKSARKRLLKEFKKKAVESPTTKQLVKKATAKKNLLLEKERMFLRRQQNLENKLRDGKQVKGVTVKGVRYTEVSLLPNGKLVTKGTKGSRIFRNVELFPVISPSGAVRYTLSRKIYLKILKRQIGKQAPKLEALGQFIRANEGQIFRSKGSIIKTKPIQRRVSIRKDKAKERLLKKEASRRAKRTISKMRGVKSNPDILIMNVKRLRQKALQDIKRNRSPDTLIHNFDKFIQSVQRLKKLKNTKGISPIIKKKVTKFQKKAEKQQKEIEHKSGETVILLKPPQVKQLQVKVKQLQKAKTMQVLKQKQGLVQKLLTKQIAVMKQNLKLAQLIKSVTLKGKILRNLKLLTALQQKAKQVTAQRVIAITKQKKVQKQKQVQETKQVQKQKQVQETRSIQQQKAQTITKQKPKQKQIQKAKAKPTTKQLQKTKKVTKPKEPKKPRIPFLTFKSKLKKGENLLAKFRIKRKGKIVTSREPLPINRAIKKGATLTDHTPVRSFEIKIVGKTKRKDIQKPSLSKFRLRKGRDPTVLTFVEKSKYAIDTKGEKTALKLARKLKKSL